MKYLIDAQLPRQATEWLVQAGGDAIHTLDLPEGNRTTDFAIMDCADREKRVVVTKDVDFVDAHLIQGRPHRLLLISTGNITNSELESLIKPLAATLDDAFNVHRFIELNQTGLQIRD
jgi:predicted nuclease of predicted toxin-antitoxin system